MSDAKLFDMSIEWDGIDELLKNLDKVSEDVIEAITKGLIDDALDLLGKSVDNAPIDSGDLRGSGNAKIGNVIIAKGNKNGGIDIISTEIPHALEATVGFEEPYALRQHEHTEYNHPKGGMAKYLETPLKQNATRYKDNIANKIKEVLDK